MIEKEDILQIDQDFLQKIILKSMLEYKSYSSLSIKSFESRFFEDEHIGKIFGVVKKYIEEFNTIPDNSIIIGSLKEDTDTIKAYLEELKQLDFNPNTNFDFLIRESNRYLKEQALKQAILDSVDSIERKEPGGKVIELVEKALAKDLNLSIGLQYFKDLGERLKNIFSSVENRIPTYFPIFDEFINGGFPPFTLSLIVAKIHQGKSNTIANFTARQVMNGKNVAVTSMEMAEYAYAQRFDSILTKMDINRMYLTDSRNQLIGKLKDLKNVKDRGELFIKEFPTGEATVRDIQTYLEELKLQGYNMDILYVDYINLMQPYKKAGDNMYSSVKAISEELRALSFKFKIPVVSVSQLNREGTFASFEEVDFNYIAESMGTVATVDFMSIYGVDEDALRYENELHYKIVKNRLGGRVGEVGKFFFDSRSLKYYDESELSQWLEESAESGDDRKLFTPRANEREEKKKGRRR